MRESFFKKISKKICRIGKVVVLLQPLKQNDGAIAQSVEQRTENPCVPGSIPGGTTAKRTSQEVLFFCLYGQRSAEFKSA